MRRFSQTLQWAPDGGGFAIDAAVDERLGFLRKTYGHLLMELVGVAGVSYAVLHMPALHWLFRPLPLIVMLLGGVFLARKLVEGHKPVGTQYLGAAVWVAILGILVTPLAIVAQARFGSYAILGEAFTMTACVFTGLTAYVFFTKKDFSFLGGALTVATFVLFGFGIISIFFGFSGSSIWSILWVVLLSGWILYDTSKLVHHRRVGEHVAASVDLLVDFVYLFIHIAMLLMNSRD